jgi:hypothetical protein
MALAMFVSLIAQFLVGIAANLWVRIPSDHPGVSANYFVGTLGGVWWALTQAALLLQVHVALGVVVGVGSVVLGLRAFVDRRSRGIWWPIVGWVGVAMAAANGAAFLNYGHAFSSMLMSVGFAIAILSYAMWLRGPL